MCSQGPHPEPTLPNTLLYPQIAVEAPHLLVFNNGGSVLAILEKSVEENSTLPCVWGGTRVGRPERVGGTQALRSRQVWYLIPVRQTSAGANKTCEVSHNPAPACPSGLTSHTSVSQTHWPLSDAPARQACPLGPPASSCCLDSPSRHWPCQHLLTCAYIWPLQNGLPRDPSLCESPATSSPGIMSLLSVCPGNVRLCPVCECVLAQCLSPWFCYRLVEGRDHKSALSPCILRTEHRVCNAAGFQWIFAEWMNYWHNLLSTLRFRFLDNKPELLPHTPHSWWKDWTR